MRLDGMIMTVGITVIINLCDIQMERRIFVQRLMVKEAIIFNNGGIVDGY